MKTEFIKINDLVVWMIPVQYLCGYEGLILPTTTKPPRYVLKFSKVTFGEVSTRELISLWPHRTYSKRRPYLQTEFILSDELGKRGFINRYGEWIKVCGRTYPFSDLMLFETFALPDELDAALGGSVKLYSKTGKNKYNLCLPDEKEKVGTGEQFIIEVNKQVIFCKKDNELPI